MAESVDNTLLAPRFLFRFAVPVLRSDATWKTTGVALDESYRLMNLAELDANSADRERQFADVRAAWNLHGLFFNVSVTGKGQPVWCRDERLEDSDGLQVWIDTRATLNIHRASRYCHRYAFLPAGGSRNNAEPVADQLLINRARENARPIRPRELQVASKITKNGYALSAFVPGVALGGYDPLQHRQIGFTYSVYDRELGLQTFATGPAFPFQEDPTCWAVLELTDN
ncbi:MAG TPA: hypothetical protein VHU84_11760 [Lacipirellulaceae bacterium]|jgi:hypothetical protein|nr:hypothetical protein [Lacipirellulaceae bacterium]